MMGNDAGINLRMAWVTIWLLSCHLVFSAILPEPGVMLLDTIKPCPLISDPNNPSPVAGTLVSPASPSVGLIEGFVLHTQPGNSLGEIISYNCDVPNFGDASNPLSFGAVPSSGVIVLGEIYYISSVVWSSCGNLSSIVEISPGQPVIWDYDRALQVEWVTPEAPINLCQGDAFDVGIQFSVPGNYELTYSIDGSNPIVHEFQVSSFDEVLSMTISDSGTYCIGSAHLLETTCPVSFNSIGCILANFFSRPEVAISGSAAVCEGDEHCFEMVLMGQGPFTLVIENSDANAEVFSNQPAGILNHCVGSAGFYGVQELIDFNGCEPAIMPPYVELVVNDLPALAALSTLPVALCGEVCGEMGFEFSAGSFPMQLTLLRPFLPDTVFEVNSSPWELNVCEPGEYILFDALDANQCRTITELPFTADIIAMPFAPAGLDQRLCLNESTEIGSPASAGVTYSWQPDVLINPSFEQNPEIIVTPVDTGWVSLVIDAIKEGCIAHDTVNIYTYGLPDLSVQLSDNAICSGECVQVIMSGADAYSWNEPSLESQLILQDTLVICPDSAMNVIFSGINFYDSLSCMSSQLVGIDVSLALTAEVVSDEVCYGSCEGSAAIILSGGIPPYFSDELNDDFVAEFLCPGFNEVIVTDAAGCADTIGFTIVERPQETVDYFSALPPVCDGDSTGQVNSYDAGADFMAIYQNNASFPFLTDETAPFNFSELPAGNYKLVMTVGLNEMFCYDTVEFSLESLSPAIGISLESEEGPFCEQSQVCLQANGVGGFGNLTAHWNRCEESVNCQSSQLNPFCFSISRDTIFYVHVTDQNGCSSDTLSVASVLYDPLNTSISGFADSAFVCEYDCINLNASASGGNGDYHYSWITMPAGNSNALDSSAFRFCPTYSLPFQKVIVKLFDNCVSDATDTLVLEVKNTPDFQLSANIYDQCVGSEFKLFYDLETQFSDTYNCEWNFDNGEAVEFCGDTSVVFVAPGFYEPYLRITSEYGCTGLDTMNENYITAYQQPELDFWWEPEQLNIINHTAQFNCEPYGIDSVIWNFHNAGRSTLFDPVWTFPSIESEGPFFVCLIGFSGKGCLDTLCRDVVLNPVAQVFAPNSFTPNGDGINDVFRPFVSGVLPGSYNFKVYTRRGETIFSSDETDAVWTGGINDNGYYVAPGPYVWRIEFRAKQTDKIEVYTGTVNLLR
jgi:gliding motility-associated-like protein